MRRGDFEALVRRHLDGELVPRGFKLTPLPPENWEDEQPHAVYGADPDDFNRRSPALAVGGDPRCIDLWIQLDPKTGHIRSTLNGPSIDVVTERLGLTRRPTSGPQATDIALQLTDLGARLSDLLDTAKRHILPERLQAKVHSFPEVSMGAQRIALVLATGQMIDDVVVAWGKEVLSVAGHEPPALPLHEVVDVVDRSDSAKGR